MTEEAQVIELEQPAIGPRPSDPPVDAGAAGSNPSKGDDDPN
jgi:hypothetical protein